MILITLVDVQRVWFCGTFVYIWKTWELIFFYVCQWTIESYEDSCIGIQTGKESFQQLDAWCWYEGWILWSMVDFLRGQYQWWYHFWTHWGNLVLDLLLQWLLLKWCIVTRWCSKDVDVWLRHMLHMVLVHVPWAMEGTLERAWHWMQDRVSFDQCNSGRNIEKHWLV